MRKAIVLGGYGLIGSACMRALRDAGFQVVGVGRSKASAMACDSSLNWLIRDIPTVSVEEWRALFDGVDVVVNASGALQNGGRDDLAAIHVSALENIVKASRDLPVRIVQISAAGVSLDASTDFFRTKAKGDGIIVVNCENWIILRPTLVLSPDAYGGTALLRAIASLPTVLPEVMPDAQIQTVHIDDVAAAVVAAAQGKVASGTMADLTEPSATSFPELCAAIRRWQGYPEARFKPPVPNFVLNFTSRIADRLGHLGWRSPLRTTALTALRDGITGDPKTWITPCRPLEETLSAMPATRQERVFARAYLALPLAIATLSIFWLLSGLIGLFFVRDAMAVLTQNAVSRPLAAAAVFGGGVADIFLGAAILWRPWTKKAALGMIAVSLTYLLGALIFAPALWADPLGPMIKVFPGITLAMVVWLLIEER